MSEPIEWERVPSPVPDAETFRHMTRPLLAIRSQDFQDRWHLSVSHRDRVPTWEELGIARDALLPRDVHFMLPHPPRRYWLNYNARVLHLWEMRDPELAEQFEWEGEQARLAGYGEPS